MTAFVLVALVRALLAIRSPAGRALVCRVSGHRPLRNQALEFPTGQGPPRLVRSTWRCATCKAEGDDLAKRSPLRPWRALATWCAWWCVGYLAIAALDKLVE